MFSAFSEDNDPYGEHDFARFELAAERMSWKIDDYADGTMAAGAEDPADPDQSDCSR